MAAHSSILAWKIPWTEEPGYGLQTTVHGVAKSWTRLRDFTSLCMDVRIGLERKLSAEELMLLNCGVGEDS